MRVDLWEFEASLIYRSEFQDSYNHSCYTKGKGREGKRNKKLVYLTLQLKWTKGIILKKYIVRGLKNKFLRLRDVLGGYDLHVELSSNPQPPCKEPGLMIYAHNPNAEDIPGVGICSGVISEFQVL